MFKRITGILSSYNTSSTTVSEDLKPITNNGVSSNGSHSPPSSSEQNGMNYGTLAISQESSISPSSSTRSSNTEYLSGIPPYVYLLTGCAALNSCNLGFDIGVNTDAGILVQNSMGLSDVHLELFMGSINLFAIVGAITSSRITNRYGLRVSFGVASIGFILGILVMVLSQSYATLMFGRIFVGLGVGFGLSIGPMYISEISPKSHRGKLVSWAEIGVNIGIVIGFVVGFFFYPLPPNRAWRYMFATGMIMPVIMVLLAWLVMAESPRWLVQKNREEEALAVLKRLHPAGYNIQEELEEIKDDMEEERRLNSRVGWDAIFFPSPAVKKMLIVGIGTAISQQMSGIDAIQYYLVFIMEEAGIHGRRHQSMFLTGLGLLKLACIFVAAPLFDNFGRRPMIFISLSGCTVALLLIASDFFAEVSSPTKVIIGLAIYVSFFSLGLGPLGWVIPSEIFSTTIRAKAISTTTFMNRLTGTLVTSSILTLTNWLSWGGYFLFLACTCLAILAFFVTHLPETKGKSLEEMAHHFAVVANDKSILLAVDSDKDTDENETEIGPESKESVQLLL
mmetsp:Transcript_18508/g.26141  ORF Transcript_18508/g.26141 Transcript_18508/m.26141 type:complete len:564 (-) Transcript_18508:408-2099(-)